MMSSFPELYLTWNEVEYRCRINMDVLTQIEQRVPLQALAHDVVFNRDNVKLSHVAWLVYCILKGAGAPVTADDIWQAMKGGDLEQSAITSVLEYAITEIYGSGPEVTGKKSKAKPKAKRKKATT